MDDVSLPISELTTRQLLIYDISLRHKQQATLERLDMHMGSLAESVEQLQAAVDDVAVRFATQLVPLQEALAEAEAQLAEAQLDDAEMQEALDTALAQAREAAETIAAEVQELNLLGAEPDVPVEPVDPEEMPDPPSEGEGGATGPTGPDAGATGPTGPDTGATGPTGPDTGATGGAPPAPDQTLPGDLPPDQAPVQP